MEPRKSKFGAPLHNQHYLLTTPLFLVSSCRPLHRNRNWYYRANSSTWSKVVMGVVLRRLLHPLMFASEQFPRLAMSTQMNVPRAFLTAPTFASSVWVKRTGMFNTIGNRPIMAAIFLSYRCKNLLVVNPLLLPWVFHLHSLLTSHEQQSRARVD